MPHVVITWDGLDALTHTHPQIENMLFAQSHSQTNSGKKLMKIAFSDDNETHQRAE